MPPAPSHFCLSRYTHCVYLVSKWTHVSYQMFAFDGTPVQAEVSITIRGEDPDVSAALSNQALAGVSDTGFLQQDDALYLSSLSWLFQ